MDKAHWAWQSVFYHIYPLGLCGAPERNDFRSAPCPRLDLLHGWLDHIQGLGANALYLGPIFESSAHGYDTADYFQVDRRLGDNGTLKRFSDEVHRRGLRLVLDGVFHHVGRDFWAFKDILAHGRDSRFTGWFHGLDFSRTSPHGDPFAYQGWNGHYDLVKLNVGHPEVRDHLFEAVASWLREYDIDGLRLDAADCLDPGFLRDLVAHCRLLNPEFWLMGEAVHGDYRRLAGPGLLDSATNYEAYKGLFSSHNDGNYFEIAYSLDRQFGKYGLYRDLPLYAFADNHDVDRVASALRNQGHLYPLYILLLTMPGVSSLYYGSEWGVVGKRNKHSDRPLRPALELADMPRQAPQPDLPKAIRALTGLRRKLPALRSGDYRNLHIDRSTFAFARRTAAQQVVVAVNSSGEAGTVELNLPGTSRLADLLNQGRTFVLRDGKVSLPLDPCWGRVMLAE